MPISSTKSTTSLVVRRVWATSDPVLEEEEEEEGSGETQATDCDHRLLEVDGVGVATAAAGVELDTVWDSGTMTTTTEESERARAAG